MNALYQLHSRHTSWTAEYGSAHLGDARATSEALIALGLIERRGAMRAASGRWLNRGIGAPTPLGEAVLKACKDRLSTPALSRALQARPGGTGR